MRQYAQRRMRHEDQSAASAASATGQGEQIELAHQVVHGWHLLVVRGELSSASSHPLAAALESILAAGGQRIILDLARATAVAAECLRPLAKVSVKLRAVGGDLRLVVDGVATLHAIREAGLSGQFEIHRYVGDIVGAVAGLDEGGRGRRRGFTSATQDATA